MKRLMPAGIRPDKENMRRQGFTITSIAALALVAATLPPGTARAQKAAPPAPPPESANSVNSVPSTQPRIVFGGNPLPFPTAAPYRDPADGILCVSPDSLAPLGVVYIVDDKMGKVTFSATGGAASVTVDLRKAPTGGDAVFVPAIEVIEGLGGKCEWEATTGTLYARAVVAGVEMIGGQLRIRATLPILPTVTRDNGGRMVIVDIPSAEMDKKLLGPLAISDAAVLKARCGQFQSDVARVVLEMRKPTSFAILADKPATQVALNPAANQIRPETVLAPAPKTVAAAKPKSSLPAPTVVRSVAFRRVADDRMQLVVSAGRTPGTRASLARGRLTLDLLNATLGPNVMASLAAAEHPFLKAARILASGSTTAQIVLDLTRAVCYSVKPDRNGSLLLDLTLPRSAGGRLAGKLIVVDAGHGGSDSGARGGGAREKDVNLAVASLLADSLREAGANVLMTRADDFFIPVDGRPAIANRASADFFISVHSDSGDSNHSINGSTVYFHSDDPYCKTLAQCIAERLEGVGGIRSRGVRTDYVRFPGWGYGVLRNSRMVAVLVECGFMSNASDVRRLTDPAQQKRIAEAIRAGLRDYIEGNPDFDTRNINPEAGGGGTIEVPAAPSSGDTGAEAPPESPDPDSQPVDTSEQTVPGVK
jgi:N-acetylmuramoyl-L-alanine amidase